MRDADGTVQSYAWTQTAGQPAVTLTAANTATPSFTPDKDGRYAATLTVTTPAAAGVMFTV